MAIISASMYQKGTRHYIMPDKNELGHTCFQKRNRVMSAGYELCKRCDGLGVDPSDAVGWSRDSATSCMLCRGWGNPTREV